MGSRVIFTEESTSGEVKEVGQAILEMGYGCRLDRSEEGEYAYVVTEDIGIRGTAEVELKPEQRVELEVLPGVDKIESV